MDENGVHGWRVHSAAIAFAFLAGGVLSLVLVSTATPIFALIAAAPFGVTALLAVPIRNFTGSEMVTWLITFWIFLGLVTALMISLALVLSQTPSLF